MNKQFQRQLQQQSLLHTATALCAARDNLLLCAEMLREHLFNVDIAGRQRAIQVADEMVSNAKNSAPPGEKTPT